MRCTSVRQGGASGQRLAPLRFPSSQSQGDEVLRGFVLSPWLIETAPGLEISGDVLSTADMVVQRRDGPRRLREIDDDDEGALKVMGNATIR